MRSRTVQVLKVIIIQINFKAHFNYEKRLMSSELHLEISRRFIFMVALVKLIKIGTEQNSRRTSINTKTG
jgi:hypothetical protein